MGIQDESYVRRFRSQAKWDRLVKHLGISMSLMSGEHVTTTAIGHMGVAASTQKNKNYLRKNNKNNRWQSDRDYTYTVSFDPDLIGTELPSWLGAAWHELGHILWSTFDNSILAITQSLNLLEDARIESLMITKYPKTRGAILALLLDQMKGSIQQEDSHLRYQYAWVAGRGHIPKARRLELRELIDGKIAKQIDRIFADYLSMGDKLDTQLARKLADELEQILLANDYLKGHSICNGARTGRDNAKSEGLSIPAVDTTNESGETDDDGIGTGADTEGGISSSDKAANRAKVKKIKDAITEELKQAIETDVSLQHEVEQLRAIMQGTNNRFSVGVVETIVPTRQATNTSNQIRKIAAKFNDESGKGLVRHRDSGRLRPIRYERTGELDAAYDMWEPGLEQEMMIGVAIDMSGSMNGSPINEVAYGLEVGLSDVADVELAYFHDDIMLTQHTNSHTRMNKISARGGTDPSDAVSYLYSKLHQSAAQNRMLIIYTDGAWNDRGSYVITMHYVDRLIAEGVSVHIVVERFSQQRIDRLLSYSYNLTEDRIHKVNGLQDLPPIVLSWTTHVLSKPLGA